MPLAGCYDLKSMAGVPAIFRSMTFIRHKLRCLFVYFVVSAATLGGWAQAAGSSGGIDARQILERSQQLQQAGKLTEAAGQYRAFLATVLGELADSFADARDYRRAAPLFNEALALQPDSASLLLHFAQTALVSGDFSNAKNLAEEVERKFPGDREGLAQAHQVLGRTLLKLNRDAEARKEFEAAVELDSTFANGYDLAVACLDLNDEKCAVQVFAEMEKSFGDTPEIHMAFGRAYGDSDFQPRAVTEFRRAIEEDSRLPGAHYLLAAVLLATGNAENPGEAAEAELKKELAISPRDPMSYTALGKIELDRNRLPEAETYLKQAIALDPASPDAYLFLGQVYFNTERFADAESALEKCVRLTKDPSRNRFQVQKAHYLLGRMLMKNGQTDAAHAEMTMSRELADKTLAQDKSRLAGLMETSGSREAEATSSEKDGAAAASAAVDAAALRKGEATRDELKPAVADSYNNLGAIAATGGDFQTAVTYFARAAAWEPSLEGLDYNWGRAAFAGSQFADAVPPLSRYVKAQPGDVGARSVLGISQFRTGDYRGCIETLQPVMGTKNLDPLIEYSYAESMVLSGNVGGGVERLSALEKAHPEIGDVHRALGEAFDQQGQKEHASEELRAAIRLNAGDAEAHYDLGKMELQSRDHAGAIAELEAAVQLAPGREPFHRELADAYTAAGRLTEAQKEIAACATLREQQHEPGSPQQAGNPKP